MSNKKVYTAISADFFHTGHLNVIKKASSLGELTVGLLTDQAISRYKRLPILTYEQRFDIVSSIKGVTHVIPQDSVEYSENLAQMKPDFVVHGDDWIKGTLKEVRQKVIEQLKGWGGELVEIPHAENLAKNKTVSLLRNDGITPDIRRSLLRRLLNAKGFVTAMEAHNGLSALIVENTKLEEGNEVAEFDCIWESSLTDSTSKGKPDIQAVDISSRVKTIDEILEVSSKPVIVDADNGGMTEHFVYTVRTLERLGVSAVIIEDKVGAKKNSLFGTEVEQNQASIDEFCEKIHHGKKVQVSDDFMIIARIESLILGQGEEDALTRAFSYCEAGADGIMIHSKADTPDEILSFISQFRKKSDAPLVVVPTTYSTIYESELKDAGANIVIYANHLLRSAFPAMVDTAKKILKNKRGKEASENCMAVKEILTLIPELKS